MEPKWPPWEETLGAALGKSLQNKIDRSVYIPDDWEPTKKNVDGLPGPLKRYIRTLEDQVVQKISFSFDQEEDSRWIAKVNELPGVMSYGNTKEEAFEKAVSLVFQMIGSKKDD